MRKFVAILLLITGLALAGFAYSCYSEYQTASNVARYFRTNPNAIPTLIAGETREQYIAGEMMAADRNRTQAILSASGGLLFLLGGAALLVFGRKKERFTPAPDGGLNEDPTQRFEAMNRWASGALARPIKIQFKRRYAVLFASIMIFFTGISLLMIAVNGFTAVSLLILVLNVSLLFFLYYIMNRAQRKSLSLFDSSGVVRRDNRRFNWGEFKSVDYLMAIKPRSGREYLWRIELAFSSGEAWIIPQRVKNWDEINRFVATLPGTHQKRTI